MSKTMTITILHNIFLTREERYKLIAGDTIEVVGASVPVWFNKGKTNEPGQEVFCKYRIHNKKTPVPITMWDEGYEINLPQATEKMVKLVDPIKSDSLIGETVLPPTAANLRDICDDGSECLNFKQYTKVRKDDLLYNMLHFVEIKDMSVLEQSITDSCEATSTLSY